MKKTLLGIIIGILVGTASSVLASTLLASNIAYTPKDSSWGVNNVEAAIDSLKLSKTSDNYSTDEKVVGTWIDGKPLYQITIFKDKLGGGTSIIESNFISNYNVARVIKIDAILSNSNGTGFSALDNDLLASQYVNVNNNGAIEFKKSSTSSSTWEIVITLQYTKTTD